MRSFYYFSEEFALTLQVELYVHDVTLYKEISSGLIPAGSVKVVRLAIPAESRLANCCQSFGGFKWRNLVIERWNRQLEIYSGLGELPSLGTYVKV